jgi:CrcB protein
MPDLSSLLLVLAGGFCGGVSRFFVSGVVGRRIGETFPWGTLVVNVSGAACVGLLAGLGAELGGRFASGGFRDLMIVGFCGGYTTVSSFTLQTLNLAQDREPGRAALNVIASLGLCMVAVAAGVRAAAAIAS